MRISNGSFAYNGAMAGCNCHRSEEFGDNRHKFDCPCAADVEGWLFYRHDGELEAGADLSAAGVFVNPHDRRQILLLVRDALIPVGLSEHRIVYGAGEDFRRPPSAL
jgi:hypothetical protein